MRSAPPMTAILGFTENLIESGLSDADRLNAAHTIRRNGEYLLNIINDILDLSKVEAGRMNVERIACAPCELIADLASLVKIRADEKKLAFHVEYVGSIPDTIHTDPIRLRQILLNLIGNAIKFTNQGSVRLVSRFVDGDYPMMQFDVVDTGIGIAPEQEAQLFQAFSQGETSTARRFGGTGLGLTISKRLAQLLGGDVVLESSQEGSGSRFRVTIAAGLLDNVRMIDDPLSATCVAPAKAGTSTDVPEPLNCRILLAEDGPDNQRLITVVLRRVGAQVTPVENGRQAVDAALAACEQGCPFDVILMDMQMPVMDGYEATALLRRKGYTSPIIALTAHAMASDRERCIRTGCDDYATKPIDRRTLIRTLRKYCKTPEAVG